MPPTTVLPFSYANKQLKSNENFRFPRMCDLVSDYKNATEPLYIVCDPKEFSAEKEGTDLSTNVIKGGNFGDNFFISGAHTIAKGGNGSDSFFLRPNHPSSMVYANGYKGADRYIVGGEKICPGNIVIEDYLGGPNGEPNEAHILPGSGFSAQLRGDTKGFNISLYGKDWRRDSKQDGTLEYLLPNGANVKWTNVNTGDTFSYNHDVVNKITIQEDISKAPVPEGSELIPPEKK